MDAQAYRDKFSKYIESAIKTQVDGLAKDWQTDKLGDLYQALSDWMEVKTEPVEPVKEKPSENPLAKWIHTPQRDNSTRLGYGKKAEIVMKILDVFQSQAGTQKSKFALKAADYGMTRDDFVQKIARSINNNTIKKKRFPDLQIRYVKTNDGAMFYLSRKDELSNKKASSFDVYDRAISFGARS